MFHGLTRGLFNFCETASLITSSSISGVKSIGLPVRVSSIVQMEAKSKLNVKYFEIDTTLAKSRKLAKSRLDI